MDVRSRRTALRTLEEAGPQSILRPGGYSRVSINHERATCEVGESLHSPPDLRHGYLVDGLPVEIHCHSIGAQDFSRFEDLDLGLLEEEVAAEGLLCVPTLYLPYSRMDGFLAFMETFAGLRSELPHIAGIALEGPLLASFGGTPEDGVWTPTAAEWDQFAACGEQGLLYMVMSPDALVPGSCRYPDAATSPSIVEIVTALIEGGVRPALGHFHKADPSGSAALIEQVVETARALGAQPFDGTVITDHLFNDMPMSLRHAWRTAESREERDVALQDMALETWDMATLADMIGPVPATLIRLAHEGGLTVCLNFDGEHVDHQVARRAVELIGPQGVVVMSDRSDVAFLGGQALTRRTGNSLWYQADGVVAAGSTPLDRQLGYLSSMGFTDEDIWTMVSFVPSRVLGLEDRRLSVPLDRCCVVERSMPRMVAAALPNLF